MTKIKNIIKCLINIFAYFISLFIIRSDKVVICGGWFGERFADNSKAMFLFLNSNKEFFNLKKVFYITKNKNIYNELSEKNYNCLMANSLKGIWYQLKAKYHIVDQNGNVDLNRFCSINATRINLWHGFPLKKICNYTKYDNYSLNEVISINNKYVEISHWNKFYNLVLSEKHKELQQFAFGLEDKMMIKGVYPRTLYMFGYIDQFIPEKDLPIIDKIIGIKDNNQKIVGYFPTFRDNQEENLKCVECIQHLNEFAKKYDYYIITKLHFASHINFNFADYNHIINLNKSSDVYDYLKYINVMVSDYSSISFDFILFDRPIVYYAFDLNYYESSDRGFLFEYNKMCAGKIVEDIHKLDVVLIYALEHENDYILKYQEKIDNIKKIVYESKKPTQDDLFDLWNKISLLYEENEE